MIATMLLALATTATPKARTITIAPATARGYITLTIPQIVDAGDDGAYASIRVLDDLGNEVPFALDPTRAVVDSTSIAVTDVGFVPGRYTQALVDFGTSGDAHDSVTLQTKEKTFFVRADIASSDDRAHWATIENDTPLYRVANAGDEGNQTITIGPTRARWLRVRVLDPNRRFDITGATVSVAPPQPRLVALEKTVHVVQKEHATIVDLDFGVPNTSMNSVAFETSTQRFSRNVSLATQSETTDQNGIRRAVYDEAGSGTISRFALGTPTLSLEVKGQTQRLRVTIDNGDDPPLADLRVTPFAEAHRIVFSADPARRYRLVWGAETVAPSYDLGEQLAHAPWHAAGIAATAGEAVVLAAPVPKAPWFTRFAIPAALALACIILGMVTLKALRTQE
jgi:hypothetical protein